MLVQVYAEAQLKEHLLKFVFNNRYLKEVLASGTENGKADNSCKIMHVTDMAFQSNKL